MSSLAIYLVRSGFRQTSDLVLGFVSLSSGLSSGPIWPFASRAAYLSSFALPFALAHACHLPSFAFGLSVLVIPCQSLWLPCRLSSGASQPSHHLSHCSSSDILGLVIVISAGRLAWPCFAPSSLLRQLARRRLCFQLCPYPCPANSFAQSALLCQALSGLPLAHLLWLVSFSSSSSTIKGQAFADTRFYRLVSPSYSRRSGPLDQVVFACLTSCLVQISDQISFASQLTCFVLALCLGFCLSSFVIFAISSSLSNLFFSPCPASFFFAFASCHFIFCHLPPAILSSRQPGQQSIPAKPVLFASYFCQYFFFLLFFFCF